MSAIHLTGELSEHIWRTKYQYRSGEFAHDTSIEDTWRRVAHTLAKPETDSAFWEKAFYDALSNFRFLPGGRILAGAGTGRSVTLFNCFVMGIVDDSMDGIFDALKQGALTMQQGGGVGYDFSTLRPAGTTAKHSGNIASGPVSFMHIWDSMCATLLSTGARRGAMMATLRCDHPDIEHFIEVKRDPRELRHFNLSVLVSDAFMQAVQSDAQWPLVFPTHSLGVDADSNAEHLIDRQWSGTSAPIPCRVVRAVRARELWDKLMRATYDVAEPGVLFIDRINKTNPLWYRENISATNPCGEVPLPAYGACDLGSINLARFISQPFSKNTKLDKKEITELVRVAVRMLDNVIDVSNYPLDVQRDTVKNSRRIGLGITGLADALVMLGMHYDSDEARSMAASLMQSIRDNAYRTSVELAKEKGSFPSLDKERHLQGRFIQSLSQDIQTDITEIGLRNSHLLAIAPAGTISLLANNISSGIEPVFSLQYKRQVLESDNHYATHDVTDFVWKEWTKHHSTDSSPSCFVTARELSPQAHLVMQAAVQPFVDQAISKTINVAKEYEFDAFRSIYDQAYDLGLKGCTTYRENPITGAMLTSEQPAEESIHCCGIERESD